MTDYKWKEGPSVRILIGTFCNVRDRNYSMHADMWCVLLRIMLHRYEIRIFFWEPSADFCESRQYVVPTLLRMMFFFELYAYEYTGINFYSCTRYKLLCNYYCSVYSKNAWEYDMYSEYGSSWFNIKYRIHVQMMT